MNRIGVGMAASRWVDSLGASEDPHREDRLEPGLGQR